MAESYGIPYMGSKNSIAKWVVDQLPAAENFYDLFAGGCAITHRAIECKKYKNYIINDIDPQLPQLFYDAVMGKYANEKTWISRGLFEMLKDNDAYVRYLWSFGNKGRDYMYGEGVEDIRCAYWNCVMADDLGECKKNISVLLSVIANKAMKLKEQLNIIKSSDYITRLEQAKNKVENIKSYLREALKKSGETQAEINRYLGNDMAGHYFGNSQWALPTKENYEKMKEIMPDLTAEWEELFLLVQDYNRLERLERLESLENLGSVYRLQSLDNLQRLQQLHRLQIQKIEKYRGSYKDVPIKENSVIYCDIPYYNTTTYVSGAFDHEEFYKWAETQSQPVFISEYYMPEDRFTCIAEIEKCVLLGNIGSRATEKIFIPKHQEYNSKLTLF